MSTPNQDQNQIDGYTGGGGDITGGGTTTGGGANPAGQNPGTIDVNDQLPDGTSPSANATPGVDPGQLSWDDILAAAFGKGKGGDLTPEQQILAKLLHGSGGSSGKKSDPLLSKAYGEYVSIWGMDPPKGYLEGLLKQGMNIYEIADNERAKSAYKHTDEYRNNFAESAANVAQALGFV